MAGQAIDQGYGVVSAIKDRVLDGLIVRATDQEHGIIALRPGGDSSLPDLPVGAAGCAAPLAHGPSFRGR